MSPFQSKQPFSIFKQKGSDKWWVRFSVKGQGQQRIPLGTYDEEEAGQLAVAKYHETHGIAAAGLSVTRKKIKTIANEFIEELEEAVRRGEKEEYQLNQYPPIITRYFVKYVEKELNDYRLASVGLSTWLSRY